MTQTNSLVFHSAIRIPKFAILLNFDCFKFAGLETHPALDAFSSIDAERFSCFFLRLLLTGNRLLWTNLCTSSTPRTDVRENAILKECPADLCWASLIENMFFILILEVPDGGENGIWSRPSQLTERGFCGHPSQFLKKFNVIYCPPSFGNLCQDLMHPFGSFPTRGTLPA